VALLSVAVLAAGSSCDNGDWISDVEPGQGGADGVIIATVTPTTSANSNLLLPDLETLPLYDLHIQYGTNGRVLRFATTVTNGGDGPLELLGVSDPRSNRTTAIQRIVKRDGSLQEHIAGNFVYHPTHSHWHFEDFILFELWTYRPDGSLETQLESTGKLTFCIFDSEPMNPPFPYAAEKPAFAECGNDAQGVSLGWADTYGSAVPGQELDINDLPDGRYAIRSTADPDNRLRELDDTNNAVVQYVEVTASDLVIPLDGP
jgi:hypothetical protein